MLTSAVTVVALQVESTVLAVECSPLPSSWHSLFPAGVAVAAGPRGGRGTPNWSARCWLCSCRSERNILSSSPYRFSERYSSSSSLQRSHQLQVTPTIKTPTSPPPPRPLAAAGQGVVVASVLCTVDINI
ncbi:hypothetical protein E2C01_034006 [Portunus trituberculatus]|uniref:Secreted protein n=1 Tax=Portunus trituberculatus TaxID=210409 RepID=A0A5B7F586_PORTR|nr:hypothetical protein [Portunus trituberculatus]